MTTPTPPRGSPETAPPPTPAVEPGRLLGGRYRLEELVASGGMAQVWQGNDEVLRRQVAVKLLHPHLAADASFVTRFRQEAVAAARLAHPSIVSIYDTCSDEGMEAIVMELVAGRTLRQRLDDPTPIDPWQAAGLAAQIAEALEAAHRAGLVHRDVKPANVLLSNDGRVKVADFGIAKAVAEADLTQPGLMVGTAKYLAPEQVRGEPVDPRTDIYSLGVVLYEMLCGRAPFVAEGDAATALARLHRDPLRPRQVRPSVPRALEEVVCRAMAREPSDRFESAADLRAALLAAGAASIPEPDMAATVMGSSPSRGVAPPGPTTVAPSAPGSSTPSFTQTERGWWIPTLIVVVVAVALGIAGLLIGRSGARDLFDGVLGRSETGSGEPVVLRRAAAFDPSGDRDENGGLAHNAIDGDPATAWRTEGYNDRAITKLKAGVGLVLELASVATLDELELVSSTNDWKMAVYVADSAQPTLAAWGVPVAEANGLPAGTNKVDLHGARGGALLIWILDRGDANGRASAEIREAKLTR